MSDKAPSFLMPKPDPKIFEDIDKVLDSVRTLWINARTTEDERKWAKRLDELLDERNKIAEDCKLQKSNDLAPNSI